MKLIPFATLAVLAVAAGSAHAQIKIGACYDLSKAYTFITPQIVQAAKDYADVLNAKGGRSRTVGMDPEGFTVLQRWLELRQARLITDRAHIFCDLDGAPLRTAYIRVLMPRLAAKAGIAKRVHAHGFRHTHAAQLREEGVDIGIISKQLGHRSIATTARYLDHIAPVAVVQAMRGRRW